MKKNKLKYNIVMLSIAFFSLIVSSYAWFLIIPPTGDSNIVHVYSGDYLYVSLDPLTGYQPTLDFQDDVVGGAYETGQNLIPITTSDGLTFYYKDGELYTHPEDPTKRWFFEFDLYLKSNVDKYVYLGEGSGFVDNPDSDIEKAIRVGYVTYSDDELRTVEQSIIWEPDNDGEGSYGEGIYDENYIDPTDEDYICHTAANPSGYIICPTSADKTEYASHTYTDSELAVTIAEEENEDLSGITPIVYLEGGSEAGRLLTLKIWIEGFDPDSNYLFLLSNEEILLEIDFTLNLYFATREVVA